MYFLRMKVRLAHTFLRLKNENSGAKLMRQGRFDLNILANRQKVHHVP